MIWFKNFVKFDFMNLIEYFEGSASLNIFFLVTTLFSIFLAFYFYFKGRKEKIPLYSKKTTNIISKHAIISNQKVKLDDLNIKIFYRENELDQLSLTKIAIWNDGKKAIRDYDIIESDKLRIEAKNDITIYDFEVDTENVKGNPEIHKIDDNQLQIKFDFLDQYDGLLFQIYHSGTENNDIKVLGSFIESKKMKKGVSKGKLADKWFSSKIYSYLEKLANVSSNPILQFPLVIITIGIGLIITLPFMIPISLYDYVYDRFYNKTPKKFFLGA